MNNSIKPKVSLIIPCKNEGLNLKQTVNCLLGTEARDKAEIIIINDGSQDRSCDFLARQTGEYWNVNLINTKGLGASRARNLGAEAAQHSDILVFCDAHINVQQGWLDKLLDSFSNPEVDAVSPGIGPFNPSSRAGYGQMWDEKLEIKWLEKPSNITEIPLAPGACLAMKKEVFDAVGGFDSGFNSWGYEDVELSLKLWLFGFRVFVTPFVRIGHQFRKVTPYKVDIVEFYYNRLRIAISHLNEDRIAKVVTLIQKSPDYSKTIAKMFLSDSLEQRKSYFEKRKYNDSWFFDRFKIPF